MKKDSKENSPNIGYKYINEDLTNRYNKVKLEVGKWSLEIPEEIIELCKCGWHFYKNKDDAFEAKERGQVVYKIEYDKLVASEEKKSVSNRIKLIEYMEDTEEFERIKDFDKSFNMDFIFKYKDKFLNLSRDILPFFLIRNYLYILKRDIEIAKEFTEKLSSYEYAKKEIKKIGEDNYYFLLNKFDLIENKQRRNSTKLILARFLLIEGEEEKQKLKDEILSSQMVDFDVLEYFTKEEIRQNIIDYFHKDFNCFHNNNLYSFTIEELIGINDEVKKLTHNNYKISKINEAISNLYLEERGLLNGKLYRKELKSNL
jgi:hypothetical protein